MLDLCLGSIHIPLLSTLDALVHPFADSPSWEHTVIWSYRLPKSLTTTITGSGLALCGLLMQRLFQNALAGPFVLGVSSGASLGAALFFMGAGSIGFWASSWPWIGELSLVLACVLGGFTTMILIAWASLWVKQVQSLLIVGLMLGSFESAITSVLAYFSQAEQLQRYAFWSFGSLGSLTWNEVLVLAVIWGLGVIVSSLHIKGLNALLAGDVYLRPLGISQVTLKWSIILVTALITGGLTAYVGPIAFVGLAVPHISRMLFVSTNHRIQLPSTLFLGAILLLICDTIAQVPGSSVVLPINAITSFFGAPIVIWLIVKRTKIAF